MAKVANAILILRKGNSIYWTSDMDQEMINWCQGFIEWFTTYWIALEEAIAPKSVSHICATHSAFTLHHAATTDRTIMLNSLLIYHLIHVSDHGQRRAGMLLDAKLSSAT